MIVNRVVAAEDISPTFEVKYLLDSGKVLNKDMKLKNKYKKLFNVKKDPIKVSLLFLETPNRDFSSLGWINRIRKIQGQDKFGIVYKRRYAVENGDLDAVYAKIKEEGFMDANSLFNAEVDWGYSKMTLSLSCKLRHETAGYAEGELPKKAAAISMVQCMMPNIERDAMREKLGTKDIFKDVKKAGPVTFDRYIGSYKDTLVDVEVLPITDKATGKTTYVTELSFRKYNLEDATALRAELADYLDEQGINVHEDSLKTAAILDACLGKN